MYKYITILVLCLLLLGCKTKHVQRDKLKVEQQQDFNYSEVLNQTSSNQVEKQLSETDMQEFMQLFKQLNVQYDGQSLEDKLNVLLQKTEEGTQITLSGTGKVQYAEENQELFYSLEKRLIAKQDSIVLVQNNQLQLLKNDLYAKIDTTQKEVETKTFAPAVWIILALCAVLGIFLNWLSKQFKGH